jgi:hypothetical protein
MTMRFMMIYKPADTKDMEAGVSPTQDEMAKMGAFIGELAQSGVLLATDGLQPSSKGALVRLTKGKLTVTDGPFTETKEMISYAVYEVRSREEAVEWASRFLAVHRDLWPGWEGTTELRRVFGPEDFGPPA